MKLCKNALKVFAAAAAMALPFAACDDRTAESTAYIPPTTDAGATYDAGDALDGGNVDASHTDGGSWEVGSDAAPLDGGIGGGPAARLGRHDVAGRIAEARCERHRVCGTLGVPYKYASKEACVNAEHARALEELRSNVCSEVAASSAQACIDQATNASCQTIFDPVYLPIMGRCSAASMCSPR